VYKLFGKILSKIGEEKLLSTAITLKLQLDKTNVGSLS
jgi:hypothetical protein